MSTWLPVMLGARRGAAAWAGRALSASASPGGFVRVPGGTVAHPWGQAAPPAPAGLRPFGGDAATRGRDLCGCVASCIFTPMFFG